MKRIVLLLCLLLGAPLWANSQSEQIKKFTQDNVELLISIITNEKLTEQDKFSEISKAFVNAFDLPRLAAMSIGGVTWKKLKTEERKQFTSKYADFVLSFYSERMATYNNNKIVYGEPILKSATKAVMPIEIEFQGKMAKLNYSVLFNGKVWKIYDVEVEGIRLTTTYRSQLQSVFRKKKFAGLISELDLLIQKNNSKKEEPIKTK